MTALDQQLAKIEALARLMVWLRFQPQPTVDELAEWRKLAKRLEWAS